MRPRGGGSGAGIAAMFVLVMIVILFFVVPGFGTLFSQWAHW